MWKTLQLSPQAHHAASSGGPACLHGLMEHVLSQWEALLLLGWGSISFQC